MMLSIQKYILFFFILSVSILSLQGQSLFWEYPSNLTDSNGFFPQAASSESSLTAVWQQYDSNERLYLYGCSSNDGKNWNEPRQIIGPIDYFWENRVSLFSLTSDSEGNFYIALLINENETVILKKGILEDDFSEIKTLRSEDTALAPKLFAKENGGIILFTTQRKIDDTGLRPLSLYYTESDEGLNWSEVRELVNQPNRLYNFLPYYVSNNNTEYVVYQSKYSLDEKFTYQLFMQKRDAGSDLWSDPEIITQIDERFEGTEQPYHLFDNERPALAVDSAGDVLITWERRYLNTPPRVYYGRLDTELGLIQNSEAVSEANLMNAFPRFAIVKNKVHLVWFNDRSGNQVILAENRGNYWREEVISPEEGSSFYAYPFLFQEELYIVWDNRVRNRARPFIIQPDKSLDSPRLSAVNFTPGIRSKESTAVFSWLRPNDSSGVQGYSYSWDRDPEGSPPLIENTRIPPNRRIYVTADKDGPWYFHLIALDRAGNWSDPVHIEFVRDTTPPSKVVIQPPQTDEIGYLLSNTFTLGWVPPPDDDVASYTTRLQYIGNNDLFLDPDSLILKKPDPRTATEKRGVIFRNRDNGLWAFSVSAIDYTGNISEPSTIFLNLNKYIPVTYISFVDSRKDEQEQIILSIQGRGFSAGGKVVRVIIDDDGKAPFDYSFYLEDGAYTVDSDRKISGPVILDIPEGVYYIAVEHPRRGIVFARSQVKIDATGTVKFGNFLYEYREVWKTIQQSLIYLHLNRVIIFTVLLLLLFLSLFSVIRLTHLFKEHKDLTTDSKALMSGDLFTIDILEERLKAMKKRGLGLRIKFIFSLLSLVIAIVVMVSLVFGWYMIDTQIKTMTDDLNSRSSLLLETLAASGQEYLPAKNSIALGVLPEQISSIDEARSMTITGIGETDSSQYNYIWGSNDPDINLKQKLPDEISIKDMESKIETEINENESRTLKSYYTVDNERYILNDLNYDEKRIVAELLLKAQFLSPVVRGTTAIDDEIEAFAAEMEAYINEEAGKVLNDLVAQKSELSQEIDILESRGTTAAFEEISTIQAQISLIDNQISEKLKEIKNLDQVKFRNYPVFDPETFIQDENNFYTYYKPIIYSDVSTNSYYKGMIRLTITVKFIKERIKEIQNNITIFTVVATGIAILIGIIGALLLSSTMIRPIKKLVAGVEIIRDTQDMKRLKDHHIEIKTRDEMAQLAETINQMTYGLVKAAAAQEDLTIGKEVQKMFIPLAKAEGEDRKLTTGSEIADGAEFFGYYEGAKGVSGDYFDFRKLDDEHYAIIKCDISGKGIPASLIMVEVATIFINYFKNNNIKKDGIHIDKLVYNINGLVNDVGFKGRFAALIVVVMNIKTGKSWMCNAGDNLVHIFNGQKEKMEIKVINEVPAAGVFPNFMIEGDKGYKQVLHSLNKGDIMFLFTDGIEEAQRKFRNKDFELITCDDSCAPPDDPDYEKNRTHPVNNGFEEFGTTRIHQVIEAIYRKDRFNLKKYHYPQPEKEFTFDFSNCGDTLEEIVIALVSVEKIFRLNPDPNATGEDRIQIDNKIDEFLKDHFEQYREYFKHPVPNEEYSEYTYYTHIKEDEQFDDLTILGIRKT